MCIGYHGNETDISTYVCFNIHEIIAMECANSTSCKMCSASQPHVHRMVTMVIE